MYGVAYEVAAILSRDVKFDEVTVEEVAEAAKDLIKVSSKN